MYTYAYYGLNSAHVFDKIFAEEMELYVYQGLVVQSIVSLTSSLRGQLVNCSTSFNQIHVH